MTSFRVLAASLALGWALGGVIGCDGSTKPPSNSDLDTDFDPSEGDGDETDNDPPDTCRGMAPSLRIANAQTLDPIIEDDERCMLYGVDRTGNQVYYIDTQNDVVAQTVVVGTPPVDVALSFDKRFLYVAVFGESKIVKLDAQTGALLGSVITDLKPYRIAQGADDRVFYVEEAVFSAVRSVTFASELDVEITGVDFHEPDLEASPDGKSLFVGEANQPGSRLFHLDGESPTLEQVDVYQFDGGFTLPSPDRRIFLGRNNRIYFADRAFAADDLVRMRGWLADQIIASTTDGKVLASDESVFDGQTFVRFANRAHPNGGAVFSKSGRWFYEFDPDGSQLYRTLITTLVGTHKLGETAIPPGTLAQRHLNQLVADPIRPYLYGLDPQQNTLVTIDRNTLLPLRAEVIGSAPTDMAISADNTEMVVATFGATELAILDLNETVKTLKEVIYVPGNPFKVAISALGQIVYAEQDQYCDVTLLERASGDILSTTEPNSVFQPDVEFDPTGQFLYAGESLGPDTHLRKFDLTSGLLVETVSTNDSFFYPSRRVVLFGDKVYYAGRAFDADDLAELHDFGEEIVLVTPDGKFAVSNRKIFDLETYEEVDGLPVDSPVIAASPDSDVLYQFDNETGALFVQGLPND